MRFKVGDIVRVKSGISNGYGTDIGGKMGTIIKKNQFRLILYSVEINTEYYSFYDDEIERVSVLNNKLNRTIYPNGKIEGDKINIEEYI